jgi:hypothetical protein
MSTLHLPPLAQVEQMIRECLTTLPQGAVVAANREEVIASCVGPVMLLIEAVHLAGTANPVTEAVLIQCIRRLNAQAEEARRVDRFSNLLTKLSNHRKHQMTA